MGPWDFYDPHDAMISEGHCWSPVLFLNAMQKEPNILQCGIQKCEIGSLSLQIPVYGAVYCSVVTSVEVREFIGNYIQIKLRKLNVHHCFNINISDKWSLNWGYRRINTSLRKLCEIKSSPSPNIINNCCGDDFRVRFAKVWSINHDTKKFKGNMFNLIFKENGSATTHLHWCFCPWAISLNIELNMSPSDSYMPCLDSLLWYPIGGFLAWQLIVLMVFGAVG